MAITGHGGQLKVSYEIAAELGNWELDVGGVGWTIRATFTRRDPFWITQRPLSLVLEIGALRWTWDEVGFGESGTIVVATPPNEGVVDVTEQSLRSA